MCETVLLSESSSLCATRSQTGNKWLYDLLTHSHTQETRWVLIYGVGFGWRRRRRRRTEMKEGKQSKSPPICFCADEAPCVTCRKRHRTNFKATEPGMRSLKMRNFIKIAIHKTEEKTEVKRRRGCRETNTDRERVGQPSSCEKSCKS